MVVGLLSVELHIGGARSLKEKRFVLSGLKQRLHGRFNVSVAEVEFQDLWQRAGLAVVAVGCSRAQVDRELAAVSAEIERLEPGLTARTEVEFLC